MILAHGSRCGIAALLMARVAHQEIQFTELLDNIATSTAINIITSLGILFFGFDRRLQHPTQP